MLNPDGNPETISSLDLVKKYIREKGFIGVKLYNSLGYKPLWNREVENQRRKIAYHKNYYRFSGHEYDAVLSELYQFCVEEEVPITAHCVMDGIEAYSQASWDFGQAKYWAEVLGQERFKNLKVNLAHFGWNSKYKWDHRKSWVEDICRMMNLYENLYADSAHHRVVIPSERKNFIRDYKEIFPQFPKVKERLLFGIDWHVIKRVENFINFKRDYITVLGESGLNSAEIDAFLGGNALKFLGLLPGGKNRNRLKDFYLYNHIEEPQWFKATI
jgi:predicted TIM-barrel fold metal-dependent hydrolase